MPEKFFPTPDKTPVIRVSVASLSHDGRGIGFLANARGKGKAVFIKGALPGQIVDCEPYREVKNFVEASLIGIIQDRSDSVKPLCPHIGICGGCALQQLPYNEQIFWKEKFLGDALSRIGRLPITKIAEAHIPIIKASVLTAYRNKAEFAFGYTADGVPALGFRQAGSHTVFALRDCALISRHMLEMAKSFSALALQSGLPVYHEGEGYLRFLVLRETSDIPARYIAICLTSQGNKDEERLINRVASKFLGSHPQIKAFIHEERKRADYCAIGQRRILVLDQQKGDNGNAAVFSRSLDNKLFSLDAASFFQVNGAGHEELLKVIRKFVSSGNRLVDLYSGVGAPALLLAENFNLITCVEADARAVKSLNENAASFKIRNCIAFSEDAAQILGRRDLQNPEFCLIDPPRAGISAKTMAAIIKMAPEKIMYISCNPGTLGRDAGILRSRYELDSVTGVDLFPQTPHVEVVTLWHRKL